MEHYDLVVIGAGSGGVRAARLCAASGMRVLVAEAGPLGGTCVNVGCIPKKLMSYAADYAEGMHLSANYGFTVQHSFSWPTFKAAKDNEIKRLNNAYRNTLDNAGAEIIYAHAQLSEWNPSRSVIELKSVEKPAESLFVSTDRLLITAGSSPNPLPIEGGHLSCNSDAVFELPELPNRIVVIGGGYIAIEMATILEALGAQVTLINRTDRFLRGFDTGTVTHLMQQIGESKLTIKTGKTLQKLTQHSEGAPIEVSLKSASGDDEIVECDWVLNAVGRSPNIASLGLDNLDLARTVNGGIEVNDRLETSVPGIYALGDVVGGPQLTPYAIRQAQHFHACHCLDTSSASSIDLIPTAVFCHPNFATVGLTESKAAERGDARVYETSFRHLRDTLTGHQQKVYMKLVVAGSEGDGRVLGAHAVGADVAEMMQCLAIAIEAGLTKAQFDATLPIHPTAAEEFVTIGDNARVAQYDGDGKPS